MLTSLRFGFRVSAEIEGDSASTGISDLPVTVRVAHLLKVEKTLLCQLVTWVARGMALVPLWIVFVVLVCPIVFLLRDRSGLGRCIGWLVTDRVRPGGLASIAGAKTSVGGRRCRESLVEASEGVLRCRLRR